MAVVFQCVLIVLMVACPEWSTAVKIPPEWTVYLQKVVDDFVGYVIS